MNNFSEAQTSVEASHLSKVYWDGGKRLEILKDVSFAVKKGEGVAILGPSGSGKTTLLNLLSGLDKPTAGEVRLEGILLNRLEDRERSVFLNKKLGFVFQFYHLLPELTAFENVMLPGLIGRDPENVKTLRARAESLLEEVGLKERLRHFPSELSGGEKQRTAIARALVNDPQILFCDEPTGNLDLERGHEIAELLRKFFEKEKRTVVMVTHDERIAKMAHRVWDIVASDWKINGGSV